MNKSDRLALVFIVILTVLTISSCGTSRKNAVLNINGRPLYIEIARTREQRQRGLMYRQELEWNRGMLFVFKSEQHLSFWMKDTVIPLSIAFLDDEGRVVDLYDMEPRSLTPVRSTQKCRYAIEASRGFFREAGLSVGDRVDMSLVKR
jgi:uncharacterized membrane protein (UPF0127 family)